MLSKTSHHEQLHSVKINWIFYYLYLTKVVVKPGIQNMCCLVLMLAIANVAADAFQKWPFFRAGNCRMTVGPTPTSASGSTRLTSWHFSWKNSKLEFKNSKKSQKFWLKKETNVAQPQIFDRNREFLNEKSHNLQFLEKKNISFLADPDWQNFGI